MFISNMESRPHRVDQTVSDGDFLADEEDPSDPEWDEGSTLSLYGRGNRF